MSMQCCVKLVRPKSPFLAEMTSVNSVSSASSCVLFSDRSLSIQHVSCAMACLFW